MNTELTISRKYLEGLLDHEVPTLLGVVKVAKNISTEFNTNTTALVEAKNILNTIREFQKAVRDSSVKSITINFE